MPVVGNLMSRGRAPIGAPTALPAVPGLAPAVPAPAALGGVGPVGAPVTAQPVGLGQQAPPGFGAAAQRVPSAGVASRVISNLLSAGRPQAQGGGRLA